MDVLVSVIVPVYMVERYLQKCVMSIMQQSYDNLDIILIDDGSPDSSGLLCDQFALMDKRIHVIHQKNRGLSEARNSGIDSCKGEYILFVDGDDYIEPNTVECLLYACLEADADASCCGHFKEFAGKNIACPLTKEKKYYEGDELVASAMNGEVFGNYAWEKLWKSTLFDECRFPAGMFFEDVATTWKLFLKCHRVVCIPEVLFHYVYREDSIGNTKTMKNLADRWLAFKERYDTMAPKSKEIQKICARNCLETIGYTWRWLYIVKERDKKILQDMRDFLIDNRSISPFCSLATRFSLFCALHSNSITVLICYYMNQIYRELRGLNKMK